MRKQNIFFDATLLVAALSVFFVLMLFTTNMFIAFDDNSVMSQRMLPSTLRGVSIMTYLNEEGEVEVFATETTGIVDIPGVNPAPDLPGADNEEKIWNFLISKGYSAVNAAAIMGNIYREDTTLDPSICEVTSGQTTPWVDLDTKSVKSYGVGLFQWTFWSRKENLRNLSNTLGQPWDALDTQLEFFWWEVQGGYKVSPELMNSKFTMESQLDDATMYFHDVYEGSDDNTRGFNMRKDYAHAVYERRGK